MAERKKKSQENTNVTNIINIHGDVNDSNVLAGNNTQASINSRLSAKQNPLPIYQHDSNVHPVGDLPLGSHLPFSPNALFTGREKELKSLAQNLLGDSKQGTVITQAVTGMGGLGKTQLAVEFGYRYGKFFRGVHWINLADPTQLDSEIANCGRQMFTQDFPEDQPSRVALTLKTWKENGPNLLILDNFEETKIANEVLTKLRHSNIRILVTSRRTDWSPTLGLMQLPLDLFSPEESLKFLKDSLRSRKDSEDDLENLAERLGHLPLGLELASRYLSSHVRLNISDYLKQTENALEHVSTKNWRADMPASTGHDLDLQKTFALSWQELEDETAQKMFMMAGYLAPNTPIPLEIFERALEIKQEICDENLNVLYGLGLFRKGENNLPTIHPLFSEYAQNLAKENKEILEPLTDALATLSKKALEASSPTNFMPIEKHLSIIALYGERKKIPKTWILWNNYGTHLYSVANYKDSIQMYDRALSIKPENSTIINNIGLVLHAQGDLRAAKRAYENAIQIDETSTNLNLQEVATHISNLASVLQDMGNFLEARKNFERVLAMRTQVLGIMHVDTATTLNDLGGLCLIEGNLLQAQAYFEQALIVYRSTTDPNSVLIGITLNNLGSMLMESGNLEDAQSVFDQALEILLYQLGENHPDIGKLINNIGTVLQGLGNLPAAYDMYKRALEITESNFGTNHPSVAVRMSNIAGVLQDLGDLNGAKAMLERALAIFKKFLPADHPNIKIVQENLDSLNKSK